MEYFKKAVTLTYRNFWAYVYRKVKFSLDINGANDLQSTLCVTSEESKEAGLSYASEDSFTVNKHWKKNLLNNGNSNKQARKANLIHRVSEADTDPEA